MSFSLFFLATSCDTENCSLKDDDLAGRMGLQAKELNKLMAVLGNDRLVQV
jgi:transcription initiation factor IIE alpha subunit